MDDLKVAAIIQARMGSTRLPGKVLMPLAGKPVLWHIIHRLRKCRMVNAIAIATSTNPSDDPLVDFARSEDVELIRGPENNVLQRFALAAAKLDPDIIVRVTGDAPLIDPETVDRLVETLISEGAEYCTGEKGIDAIHEGFCPFTREALNRLAREAFNDPVAVEHVSAYFKEHEETFHISRIPIPSEHLFKGARVSVDTPVDLEFLEEVYHRLAVPAGEADISEVVQLLRSNPDLLKINKHVHQKKADAKTRRILFRCDGDEQIGLGHVVRCLALADELREYHGFGVVFAMATGEPGLALVQKKKYPVDIKPVSLSEEKWLDELLQKLQIDTLLLDIRNGLPRKKVRDWRQQGILIVTIDDPSDRRLEVDLAFYPPVPQVKELDWKEFTGKLYTGWDWVVLRREFANQKEDSIIVPNIPPRVLVTMGGSDPAGLIFKVIDALEVLKVDCQPVLVLGKGFKQWQELDKRLEKARKRYEICKDVSNMAAVMGSADMAIASFGMTAYELAAMGVPSIFLCLTNDHTRSASAFEEAGMAVNLGCYDKVHKTLLMENICKLLEASINETMKTKSLVIDGLGVERIAALLNESLSRRAAQHLWSHK